MRIFSLFLAKNDVSFPKVSHLFVKTNSFFLSFFFFLGIYKLKLIISTLTRTSPIFARVMTYSNTAFCPTSLSKACTRPTLVPRDASSKTVILYGEWNWNRGALSLSSITWTVTWKTEIKLVVRLVYVSWLIWKKSIWDSNAQNGNKELWSLDGILISSTVPKCNRWVASVHCPWPEL